MTAFDTFEFRASHGKGPRGRGCWAFFPVAKGRREQEPMFSSYMTFSQAKAWARTQRPDATVFVVGS